MKNLSWATFRVKLVKYLRNYHEQSLLSIFSHYSNTPLSNALIIKPISVKLLLVFLSGLFLIDNTDASTAHSKDPPALVRTSLNEFFIKYFSSVLYPTLSLSMFLSWELEKYAPLNPK